MKPCPFCSAELEPFGPDQFNHPRNDCWLSSVSVKAHEFGAWNRRAELAAGAVMDGTPVAWMWKEHGWAVTAHSKHRAIKTRVDVCQPPISTQQSPDFISLHPLVKAGSAPAAGTEKDAANLLIRIARNPENVAHDTLLRDDLLEFVAARGAHAKAGKDQA